MQKKKIILLATAGITVGAVIALIMTPEKGTGIRKIIKEIARRKLDVVLKKIENRLESAYERALQIEPSES